MRGPGRRRTRLTCLTLACVALVALAILTDDGARASEGRVLLLRLPSSGLVGSALRFQLVGHPQGITQPVTVCVEPPDGRRVCSVHAIPAGQSVAQLTVPLSRIGGWLISAQATGGPRQRKTVWARHPGPIRLLALGDSEMQVLDGDLATDLARYGVRVTSLAEPGSGLTNPMLLNWQSRARQLVAQLRPDVSIVALGANDGYAIADGDQPLYCCDQAWATGYGRLVSQMARTLLQSQSAAAFWFELATPAPAQFQQLFNAVNAGIRNAGRALPGRLGLIDANAFFTPGDRYRNSMTVAGQSFTIHEPDGIHLSAAADQYAAGLVVKRLLQDRVLR